MCRLPLDTTRTCLATQGRLWFVVRGLWFVVCGSGFVVRGLWFVVCGLWSIAEDRAQPLTTDHRQRP